MNAKITQYVVDVRDVIAVLDANVPPHALTTSEIVAAWYDGMERRVVAQNFVKWYRENV